MSTTKTVPPPTPLRFSLQLDRTYTEMTLAKAEGNRARAELYDLLKKVLEDYHHHHNKNKDRLADNTSSTTLVDIYEVSQRFSSDHLKAAFKQKANNGTAQQHQLLDGALLKTVVQVMGQKAIFGQNAAVDAEKYVFEIFDEYAQDYVTLCHLESPVPNGARLRIKLNAIQDVFSYEESSDLHHQVIDSTTNKNKTALVDHPKNSQPKKKVKKEKTKRGTELKISSPQQQSQTKSVYHTAKSTKFPSSSFSNNCLALDSSVTQKKKAAPGKGKKGNKKRNKRRGNNNNQQQLQQQYSSNVACHQKPSLPPLSRAQVHMFKDIFKALESEAVLEEIERQAGFLLAELADKEDEEDEGGDNKEKKNADKKGTASKKQQHLFQHLIAHLWKCVVGQVASLPTSAADRAVAPAPGYLGAQYQQLYHLVVCVHYLDALARANSYLEAAAIFELFSFVHGKVLTPYFRLEDYFTGYKEEKEEKEEEKNEKEDEDEDIEGHQDGDNGPLKNFQSQEFPSVHCVCLCGVCGLTTGALIAARAAFCDKQVVLVVTQDDFEDFEGDDHKEEKKEEEEEEDVVVLVATEEDKAGSPEVGDQK